MGYESHRIFTERDADDVAPNAGDRSGPGRGPVCQPDHQLPTRNDGKFRAFDPGQAQREKKQRELPANCAAKTRQITVEERKEIADVVKENDLPAIDLEVFFDYDSAAITDEALPILEKLGEALGSDKLKGSVFMVAGHTDAHGSSDYNLGLSNARAKSVREFLIKKFDIASDQLVAVGFGEEQLKNAEDPDAGENRRVQVVNMASKDVAQKAPAPEAEPKAKDEPRREGRRRGRGAAARRRRRGCTAGAVEIYVTRRLAAGGTNAVPSEMKGRIEETSPISRAVERAGASREAVPGLQF